MNAHNGRLEVAVAAGITLSLYKSDTRSVGNAGLYRNGAQQLAFTGFDLDEVRIVVRRSDCCLWIGRTCYEIPRESVAGIADFIGIPVQDEREGAA